jgi:hypothetical protein
MIGGFCVQPSPGQVQGQMLGQMTALASGGLEQAATNISEGAGRSGQVPVRYAFRMTPECHQRRPEQLSRCPIGESQ